MGLFDFMKKKSTVNENQKSEITQTQENQTTPDTTSGERIYYVGWVYSGADPKLYEMLQKAEMPISRMNISRIFGIPLTSVVVLEKENWTPPLYGKLTDDELMNVNTSEAQSFHKQLKKSLTNYLLQKGYSKEEIDRNYKISGYDGRGGTMGLQVVFEMNKK